MGASEFDVINRYFTPKQHNADVLIGVGDDCAVLDVPAGKNLVTSADTLISGLHFPENTSAADIAHKALAVNLSDLAAMGAIPKWFTLCLTLPVADHQWLESFSASLLQIASKYNIQLVGGDTTKGALSISIQVMGVVEPEKVMLRKNAVPDDLVYVSGFLGDAAFGLKMLKHKNPESQDSEYFFQKLNRPEPRIELGQRISEICQCAIDISDGLFVDLNHILNNSECGAEIHVNKIPISDNLLQQIGANNNNAKISSYMTGDDYELCFVLPKKYAEDIAVISKEIGVPLTCIGSITEKKGLLCVDGAHEIDITKVGFNHFLDNENE